MQTEQVWFRVELFEKDSTEPACVLGKYYDVKFLPRVGDLIFFGSYYGCHNQAKVTDVSHWMPYKAEEDDYELTEPVSIVHFKVQCGNDDDDEPSWLFYKEMFDFAGFKESDWYFGSPDEDALQEEVETE